MHTYIAQAYIVDSTGTTVKHELGEYKIIIQEYSGSTISNQSLSYLQSYLDEHLEDYSKFGGTVIVAAGFVSRYMRLKDAYPNLLPRYLSYTDLVTTDKIKLIFPSGDYLLAANGLSSSSSCFEFWAYDENDTRIYNYSFYICGTGNTLNDPDYAANSVRFRFVPEGSMTATGFIDNVTTDYYTSGYDSFYIYRDTSNSYFYKFLNRQTAQDGFSVTYDLTNCTGDPNNPSSILPNATVTTMRFLPDTSAAFDTGSVVLTGTGITPDEPIIYTWDYESGELRIGPVTSDVTVAVYASIDPYADLDVDGEADIPDADTINMPTLPPLNAITCGFIGLFSPTPAQMKLLADYMWTDFGGTGTTEVDVLKEIVQALKRTVANPLDYIYGLNIIPSQGLTVGDSVEIRFGFTSSGVSMPRLLRQYFTVNCGTLSFDTLCGDTFLDYAPYAKFSIYLPYIGIKEVDANDFVGHTIGVIYRGDVVTGGVTAFITKDGSVMYQYSGSCALTLPLSSASWGSTLSAAVQIATAIAGGAVSGGAAGAVEGALSGAANVAANPSLLSPTIARSGAVSGAAGAMAVQTPYIIREAVRFHDTAFFNTVTGYPSYYYRQLGSLHGYTKVYDIHLHGVTATSEEITEIENLLQEGVIL